MASDELDARAAADTLEDTVYISLIVRGPCFDRMDWIRETADILGRSGFGFRVLGGNTSKYHQNFEHFCGFFRGDLPSLIDDIGVYLLTSQ